MENMNDPLWLQAVVNTHNHFYYLHKKHGQFPVTGDMIKCKTDREYTWLKKQQKI